MNDVGFAVVAGAGQPVIRTFARDPALAASHLVRGTAGDVEVVLMGRVHDRDELIAGLAGRVPRADLERACRDDAHLAAAVYRHDGRLGLGRLPGDYAVAVLDRRTGRVLAVRDPLGSHPLFWWSDGRGSLSLSTSIRAVLDHCPDAGVDSEYVADFLAVPMDSLSELPVTRTPYRGVHRLLPGRLLDADLASGRVRTERMWDWSAHVPSLPADDVAAAPDLVRERLTDAVARRLARRGATAAHCSGGIDSTGVTLLAERLLAARGEHVEALTLVYPGSPVLGDEAGFARRAVGTAPGIRHHEVAMPEYLEFDGHEALPAFDEPSAKAADYLPTAMLTAAAARASASIVLTGQGGDQLFHRSAPFVAAALLRQGRLKDTAALVRGRHGGQAGGRLVQTALTHALPAGVRRPLRRLGGAGDDMDVNLRVPGWVDAGFARDSGLEARSRALRPPRFDTRVFGPGDMEFMAGDWYHWNVAVPAGLVQSRPYLDPSVVAVALGLPPERHLAPHQMKPVLAAALKDVLPPEITRRQVKVPVTTMRRGFARHHRSLLVLVRTAPIDEGILDRGALAGALDRVALGIHDDVSLWRLRMALALLRWTATRDGWRAARVPYLEDAARPT